MIQLTVPGEPVGKARPRVTKGGFVYTPKKTVNYETLIKEIFAISYPDFCPIEGPVSLNVQAYLKIPKVSAKKTEAMSNGDILPTKKPDMSNILKSVEDALNTLAYRDDKQIVNAIIIKRYSARPRIEVRVEEIRSDD